MTTSKWDAFDTIMETAPCETDPFKPPTYIVKRGFEGVK